MTYEYNIRYIMWHFRQKWREILNRSCTRVARQRVQEEIKQRSTWKAVKKMKVSADTDPTQYNSRRRIFTTR